MTASSAIAGAVTVGKEVNARERAKAAQLAQGAPEALQALVLDVLSRQAEGKTLFAGEEFVKGKVEAYAAEETSLGGRDVVELLMRGPKEASDYALLMALAVAGLRAHLEDENRLRRFLRHADWLSFATPYPAYAMIGEVLGEDAAPLWAAIERSLTNAPENPRQHAVQAMRRSVLVASGKTATHPTKAHGSQPLTVQGHLESIPRAGFWGMMRLVTGFALLQWAGRGLLRLLGLRRPATLARAAGAGLQLSSETRILGQRIGGQEATHQKVASAGTASRLSRVPLLVGAACFGLGVFVGGFWIFEGVRSGETVLLLAGAGVAGLGALLDLVFARFWPARDGRAAIEVALEGGRGFRVTGVGMEEAEAFVAAVTTK